MSNELQNNDNNSISAVNVKTAALLRKIMPAQHSGLGPGMGRPKSRITSLGELKPRQPSSRDPRIPADSAPFDLYTTSGEFWKGSEGVPVSIVHIHREQAYWSQDNQRLCSSMNGMQGRSAQGVDIHPNGPIRSCAEIDQYGRRRVTCPFGKPKDAGNGSWSRPDCGRMVKAVVVVGDCEDLVTITFKGSSFDTADSQLMSMLMDQESLWSRQFIVYTEEGARPTYCVMKVKQGALNSEENKAIFAKISEEYSAKYEEMCSRIYTIKEPREAAPAQTEPVTSTLDSDEDPEF